MSLYCITFIRYKEACLKFSIPAWASGGEWDCNDSFHLGPVVTDHMADMLLNHICEAGAELKN